MGEGLRKISAPDTTRLQEVMCRLMRRGLNQKVGGAWDDRAARRKHWSFLPDGVRDEPAPPPHHAPRARMAVAGQRAPPALRHPPGVRHRRARLALRARVVGVYSCRLALR
jgi:hypothetical protein